MKKTLITILILLLNCSENKKQTSAVNSLFVTLSFSNTLEKINSTSMFRGDIPSTPSKTPYIEGKVFDGWYNEKNEIFNFDSPLNFSQELKAKFSSLEAKELNIQNFTVESADEFNEAFSRSEGWLGGDGIYSMNLDGIDIPGHGINNGKKTIVWFSDSISGIVKDSKTEMNNFVNNALSWVSYGNKIKDIEWHYEKEKNKLFTVFLPTNPKETERFWLNDGFVNQDKNNEINLIGINVITTGEGIWGFKCIKNTIITIPHDSLPPKKIKYTTKELPFSLEEVGMISALNVNTKESGSRNADGYIYIYFISSDLSFSLKIARMLPKDFLEPLKWTFWNGTDWSTNTKEAKSSFKNLSPEMSVVQLKNGKYMMTFQENAIGSRIGIKFSDTPYIWSDETTWIWNIKLEDSEMFSYNAKAHPALSSENEIIISYNTNLLTKDKEKQKRFEHKLHPYFIKLKFY